MNLAVRGFSTSHFVQHHRPHVLELFFLLFLHVVIALKIRLHEIQQDLVCAVFPMRICIGEEKSKVTGGELIFQTGKG